MNALYTYQRVWEAFNFIIIFNVSKYDDDGEQFITLLTLFYIIFLKLTHKSPSLQQSGANFDERITKLNLKKKSHLFTTKMPFLRKITHPFHPLLVHLHQRQQHTFVYHDSHLHASTLEKKIFYYHYFNLYNQKKS